MATSKAGRRQSMLKIMQGSFLDIFLKIVWIAAALLLASAALVSAESTAFPAANVYAMGDNVCGQLGIGNATDTNSPVQVGSSEYGGPFAVGPHHMLVTDSGASLWASGDDSVGQFGDGLANSSTLSVSGPLTDPFTDEPLTDPVLSVATGLYHSLIVEEDGTVYSAGDGMYGQLGTGGTNTKSWVPVMSGADKVIANGNNSYVVTKTGELWVFGENLYGQLGTGSVGQVNTPTEVIASGVVDVAAGMDHTLVLMDDGSVMAMGYNTYGQFGDGTTEGSTIPVEVLSQGVKQVGAGQRFSIFRMADGTVQVVGINDYGQLGTGDTEPRTTLTQLPVTDVADIAVGNKHTLVLRQTGALLGVGNNADGQLGLGDLLPRTSLETIESSGVANVVAGANSTMYATRTLDSIEIEGLYLAYADSTANYDCRATWSDGVSSVVTEEAMWWIDDSSASIDINSGVLHVPPDYEGRRIIVHCSYMGMETSFTVWVQAIPLGSAMYGHGANAYSQLGLDSTVDKYTAANVTMDKVVSTAGGLNHSLFVKQDGTVWAMGENTYGQLGTGDKEQRTLPVQVMTGPAVWVGAGEHHSLVVMRDGSLWSFGLNSEGQLGTGSQVDQSSPQLVQRSGVTMADGGAGHSVYLTSGGAVFTMGRNMEGQLGDGTTSASILPYMAHSSNAIYVAAGKNHTMYGTHDTALWGMGDNSRGQLGLISSIIPQLSPTTLEISGVSQAAAGYLHSAYISMDGDLFTTGANDDGELGQGTVGTDSIGFRQVAGFADVTEVHCGGGFTVFETDGTTLYAMGDRSDGRFGNGLAGFTVIPEELPHTNVSEMGIGFGHVLYTEKAVNSIAIRGLDAVTEGKYANYDCILHWDNGDSEIVTDAAIWGEDQAFTTISTNGILSIEPSTAGQSVTVSAAYESLGDSRTVMIEQSGLMSLKLDGAGKNDTYQLGDDSDTSPHPTLFPIDTGVSEIAGSSGHTMFIREDGTLWGVGSNLYGQLGTGDTATRSNPVQIAADVAAVACGLNHTLFAKVDGSLWVMGDNYDGQLGTGDNAEKYDPTMIRRSGVTGVEAGANFSLFKTSDQDLFGMGSNQSGQLGLGPDESGTIPAGVTTPNRIASNVDDMSAGYAHTMFLQGSQLWAMGANSDGQLGLGHTSSSEKHPQFIEAQVQEIAAGDYHSLFTTETMDLMGVGYNLDGQLGTGGTGSRSTPVLIDTNVAALAAGGNHSLWVRSDGTAYGAGSNFYGQLAQGYTSPGESVPLPITDGVEKTGAGSYTSFFLFPLEEIVISGPSIISENDSAAYTCTARYSDGSTIDITGAADWQVESTLGHFIGNVLYTSEIAADTSAVVTITYGPFSETLAITVEDHFPWELFIPAITNNRENGESDK
jgi:alpha-tubulin suppressor-like RCC1 family protein